MAKAFKDGHKATSSFPYDVIAEKGTFLASKVVTKEGGFDDLSHNCTLIRQLELDEGARIGAGSTSKYLKDFPENEPLGPGAIVTNDHLSLHHSGLDATGGWKEHYWHYGSKTKYGHIILAGTLEHFRKWSQSKACRDECAKVDKGRLFAYVKGYLMHVDAKDGLASANVANGRGFIVWASGNYYEGDIQGGKKHGQGKFTWASGLTYEGQLAKGDFEGHGCFSYEDGGKYVGQVHKDKKHGEGHMVYASGNEYRGQYVSGKKQGHGEFLWANGTKYVGQWDDDNMTGKGIKTRKDGSVVNDGRWQASRL
mmetsp:Transcript_48892/g.148293  ORF Transcript_48892/g.148293 Transcript_48892/m.148293 type:complete len:310 (+) Transcript_48892:68-997(+)